MKVGQIHLRRVGEASSRSEQPMNRHRYATVAMLTLLSGNAYGGAAPPQQALEVSTQVGVGHLVGKAWNRKHERSATNGGFSAAVAVAYRSDYLFVPWLQAGWAQLASNREAPKAQEFSAEAASESSLSARYFLAGPAVEEGPLRFRVGMGLYQLRVTSAFAGTTMHAQVWDMGYFVGYGVRIQESGGCGWGLETEALLMSESQLAYFGIAVRFWGSPWAR